MDFLRRLKKRDEINKVSIKNTGEDEHTEAATASSSKERSGLFTLHSLPSEASNTTLE